MNVCIQQFCCSEQFGTGRLKIDKTDEGATIPVVRYTKIQHYATCKVVFGQTEGKGKNAFEGRNVLREKCYRGMFTEVSSMHVG